MKPSLKHTGDAEKGQVTDQKLQLNVGVLSELFSFFLSVKLLICFPQHDLPVE